MKKGRSEPRREKLKLVDDIAKLIAKYPIIGIIDLKKVPAFALQKIKYETAQDAVIKVSKKSIIKFALEKSGDKKKLIEYLPSQPGLILTKMNPFKLYKILEKNKGAVAAKVGDIPTKDIEVKAGPTDIPPGPAISTLSKVGLIAKVESGKIAIQKDKVICKAGQAVTEDIAAALALLGIKPMEVGLNLELVFENGIIFKKDVLAVDEKKIYDDLLSGIRGALNVSVNAGWPTKAGIPLMITKAFMNAKALGLEAAIIDTGIIEDIIGKAKMQAEALKAKTG